MRGTGRAAFAAILLLTAGTLDIVYGIGALDNANGNPWWSPAVFALCVYVVHGIVTFGQDERALAT